MVNFGRIDFRGMEELKKQLVEAENTAYNDIKSSMVSLRSAIEHWHNNIRKVEKETLFEQLRCYYFTITGYTHIKFSKNDFEGFANKVTEYNIGIRSYIEERRGGPVKQWGTGAYFMADFCYFLWPNLIGEDETAIKFAKKIINIYTFACSFCAHNYEADWWDYFSEYMINSKANVEFGKLEYLEIIYDFFKEFLNLNRAFSYDLIPIDGWELLDDNSRNIIEYNGYHVCQGIYYNRQEYGNCDFENYAIIRMFNEHFEMANINHLNEITRADSVYMKLGFKSIKIKNYTVTGKPDGTKRTLSSYAWQLQEFRDKPILLSKLINDKFVADNKKVGDAQRLLIAYKIGVMVTELNRSKIFLRTLNDQSVALVKNSDDSYDAFPINFNDARNQNSATGTVSKNAITFFKASNRFCPPELHNVDDLESVGDNEWAKADAYSYGKVVMEILTDEQKKEFSYFIGELISDDPASRYTLENCQILEELGR